MMIRLHKSFNTTAEKHGKYTNKKYDNRITQRIKNKVSITLNKLHQNQRMAKTKIRIWNESELRKPRNKVKKCLSSMWNFNMRFSLGS